MAKTIYSERLFQVFIVDPFDGTETALSGPAAQSEVESFLASYNAENQSLYAIAREVDRRSIRFLKRTLTAPAPNLLRIVG